MNTWQNTFKRAWRTFVQAAAGYIGANLVYVVSGGTEDYDILKTALMGLAVSAVAAGLAAVMNLPAKSGDGNADT